MAGHSHAKNIMHRKSAQSARKARAFGKLIREITVSARQGMPDPDHNPRLRAAVKAALVANMPRDTVDRAIKRAATPGVGEDWQEVRYEGYGPGGVALIVEALTDNRNRTAGDLRTIFNKNGGALAETGAVAFQFERRGVVRYPIETADAEGLTPASAGRTLPDLPVQPDRGRASFSFGSRLRALAATELPSLARKAPARGGRLIYHGPRRVRRGPHHQRDIRRGCQRQCRPGQLCCGQGGCGRHDARAGA